MNAVARSACAVQHKLQRLPRWLRLILATLLILLGMIGLVVPVLPTWVFVFLGVMLMGDDVPAARWLLEKLRAARHRVKSRLGRRRTSHG